MKKLIIIGLVVLAGAFITVFYLQQGQTSESVSTEVAENTPQSNFRFDLPEGWTSAVSEQSGVEVRNAAGETMLTISNNASLKEALMRTPEDMRSTLEEALGSQLVYKNEIMLGGTSAFEGPVYNDVMGPERFEIWAEHNGRIYTVHLDTGRTPEVDAILESFTWTD